MARKTSAIFLFLFVVTYSYSQTSFQDDFRFLKHLENLEEWNEGLELIRQLNTGRMPAGRADTLNFFQGKFLYKLKEPALSVQSFRTVSNSNLEYYRYARLFGAFQATFDSDLTLANEILMAYQPIDSLSLRIKNLQLAGMDLMLRDYDSYLERQSKFTYAYELEPYERGMVQRYDQLRAFKRKSPFVAAMLSAVVPGAGRFYMGKTGEGVAALLVTGIFGLQAWEGYRKDGIESARFIIFGSLFTISHVANIWGSAIGVRIRREEFNDQMNDSILLDMHIPLRVLLD